MLCYSTHMIWNSQAHRDEVEERCQGLGVWGRELFFKRWRCSASVWEDETVLEMDGGGGRTV